MIHSAKLSVLSIVLILVSGCAYSGGWGQNKEVVCYKDNNGQDVILTREVCQMHYQSIDTEKANLTYRMALQNLDLQKPPADCATHPEPGWCAFQQFVFNEQIATIMQQPNQAMQLQNNREERAHEDKLDKRNMILQWATFGLGAYVAVEGTAANRGIGEGVSFRGDSIKGKSSGDGGIEGGGGGSSIGKQGDTYQVYVGKGARSQITLGQSSNSGLESYEDTAQRNPVLDEGATLSPTNNANKDDRDTLGFGEVF